MSRLKTPEWNVVRCVKGAFEFLLLLTWSCGNQRHTTVISHGGVHLDGLRNRTPSGPCPPRTGARSLVLGYFVRRFVGLFVIGFEHLFEMQQSHVTRLENTVRWRWTPAMWRCGRPPAAGGWSWPRSRSLRSCVWRRVRSERTAAASPPSPIVCAEWL